MASKLWLPGADSKDIIWSLISPKLLDLRDPLISIFLVITIIPCLFRFFQEKIVEITQLWVNQMLLTKLPQVSVPLSESLPLLASWQHSSLSGPMMTLPSSETVKYHTPLSSTEDCRMSDPKGTHFPLKMAGPVTWS